MITILPIGNILNDAFTVEETLLKEVYRSKILMADFIEPFYLQGLNVGDWILVTTYQHTIGKERHLQQLALSSEKGFMASHTIYRPNGLHISKAQIIEIEDMSLTVSGVNAVNGSPVIDIRPAKLT
jgi:tRNA (adenine37-N6)-methyltransferase